MFANSDKIQAIVANHNKIINVNYTLKVNNIETECKNSVKLIAIETDNRLLFDTHIAWLCKKVANQLHATRRLQNQMGKKEKEILIDSFIYSNLSYCFLVWHRCSKKSVQKIEKIHEGYLRTILDDYESNCDALLDKSGKSTKEVKTLHTITTEIFKTLNNQNLSFMRKIFYRSPYVSHKKQNLFVHSHKTAAFGDKSLKTLGPQIWNSLPEKIKSVTNLVDF